MSRMTYNGLSWLQLSDLHVFKESDTTLMKDSFKELAEVIHPQFIVVTGDYRHLGHKQESTFDLAADYLTYIISCFGIEKEHVYLVPGNHDVTDSLARDGAISDIVEHTEARNEYYKKYSTGKGLEFTLEKGFDEYNAFVSSFYAGSNVKDDRVNKPSGVFVSTFNNKLNILHVNTALISDKKHNKDNSRVHSDIVDINQITELSSNLDFSIPSIVIGHHGLDDLYPGHKARLERILRDHYSAYLHGDIHRYRYNPIRLGNPKEVAPSIACGKSCPQDGDDFSDVGVVYYKCKEDNNVEVIAYECDVNGFREITRYPFVYSINKHYCFPLRFYDPGKDKPDNGDINMRQAFSSNNSAILTDYIFDTGQKFIKGISDQKTKSDAGLLSETAASKNIQNCDVQYLIITVNEHETAAVNKYMSIERAIKGSPTLYFGKIASASMLHMVVASTGSKDSAPQITQALLEYKPTYVMCVGIAFGREENCQRIGDLLISTGIYEYEPEKWKDGAVINDGSCPESGKNLLAIAKSSRSSWRRTVNGRRAKTHFGKILSGDKLIKDPNKKKAILEKCPEAIGGEMEGSALYRACRNTGITDEWLVVKGISDWGDNPEDPDKDKKQKIAAITAASFVAHMIGGNLKTNRKSNSIERKKKNTSHSLAKPSVIEEDDYVGYFIDFGPTSCRLFKVPHDLNKQLKEIEVRSYDSTQDDSLADYLAKVKRVAMSMLSIIQEKEEKKQNKKSFIKTFAEAGFIKAFENNDKSINQKELNRFIWELYTTTRLSVNILSQKQEGSNLVKLFRDAISSDDNYTAIINIGKKYVDIHYIKRIKDEDFEVASCDVPVSIQDVNEYIKQSSIPEIWMENNIDSIKKYIRSQIGESLGNKKAKRAIILKDERSFMGEYGYNLTQKIGHDEISFSEYRNDNRRILFSVDFMERVRKNQEGANIERIYGFKVGHIILETIFELLEVETIIPDNAISIHGNVGAYIFNVALSGSMKSDYLVEAKSIMQKLQFRVISPLFETGTLRDQTDRTDFDHAHAIRECDMLFVCNKDGIIGAQTCCEIYGAFIAGKPIAYWKAPKDTEARLDFIPHEIWDELINHLSDNLKKGAKKL